MGYFFMQLTDIFHIKFTDEKRNCDKIFADGKKMWKTFSESRYEYNVG